MVFVRDCQVHNVATAGPYTNTRLAASAPTAGKDQTTISGSALQEAAASEGVVDSFRREEAGGWDGLCVADILEAGSGSDGVGERLVRPAGGHCDCHAAVTGHTTAAVMAGTSLQIKC